jgi:protein-arginine kinase activator protein McsA
MKCEECRAAPAVIHLTEIWDGVQTNRWLCLACASRRGGLGPDASVEDVLKKFVS